MMKDSIPYAIPRATMQLLFQLFNILYLGQNEDGAFPLRIDAAHQVCHVASFRIYRPESEYPRYFE